MSRLEKATDLIVFNKLRFRNYVDGNFDNLSPKVKVWAKKSSNAIINNLLGKASKNQSGGKGFPEYIFWTKKKTL